MPLWLPFCSEDLSKTYHLVCLAGGPPIHDHNSLNPLKHTDGRLFLHCFVPHYDPSCVYWLQRAGYSWGSGCPRARAADLGGLAVCCLPRGCQLVCWDGACRLGEAAAGWPPAAGTAWLPDAQLSGWHHLARSRDDGGLSCVLRLAWKNRCQLYTPRAEYWEATLPALTVSLFSAFHCIITYICHWVLSTVPNKYHGITMFVVMLV